MNHEPSMNESSTPPGKVANAESHARACWAALERHAAACRAGCSCGFDGHVVLGRCDVGMACAEEYEIASRRVRELRTKASARLEYGDLGPAPAGEGA